MSKSNRTPKCFSTFLKKLICSGDLPTYPNHHDQITNSQLESRSQRALINPNVSNLTRSSTCVSNDKNSQVVQLEVENVSQMKPGIVARLMGLDAMPENLMKTQNDTLFFRSKSLNSLHFFPDFNSKKTSHSAFHRRSASIALGSSFSHLGSHFSFKIDDQVASSKVQSKVQSHENRGDVRQSVKKQGRREKVVGTNLMENERRKSRGKKKYEEAYATSTSRRVKKNNVGSSRRDSSLIRDHKCALLVQKKGKLEGRKGVTDAGLNVSSKKVHHDHHKQDDLNHHDVLSDYLSRSPVSVLDHHVVHLHLDYSPSKEDKTQASSSSSSRRKPTTRNKANNEVQPENIMSTGPRRNEEEVSSKNEGKNDDHEAKMAEYFVGLFGQICRMAEEQVNGPKWVEKPRQFKVQFEEELSLDFGRQIMNLLLNELIDELLAQ